MQHVSLLLVIINLTFISLTEKKLLFLTDVHLDLLYDSNSPISDVHCRNKNDYLNHFLNQYDYGKYHCDGTVNLLQSALSHMKLKVPNPDLFIIGGDMVAHKIFQLPFDSDKTENKKIFKQTVEAITSMIKDTFPNVKILPLIGNNDFYEHYNTPNEESRLEQLDFFRRTFFKDKTNCNEDFDSSTERGLYYSYYSNELEMRLIFLNSNFFSLENSNLNALDAETELDWLEGELRASQRKNEKVFILMHIPPYPFCLRSKVLFMMHEDYVRKIELLGLLYRNTIVNILSSHTHWSKMGVRKVIDEAEVFKRRKERFNLIKIATRSSNEDGVKILPTFNFPSLSPINSNNPGYSIVTIEEKRIKNIESYFGDLSSTLDQKMEKTKNVEVTPEKFWVFYYNYKEEFNFSRFDSNELDEFVNKRLKEDSVFRKYSLFIGGYNKNLNEGEYKQYLELIKKDGLIDVESNGKYLRCSNKIFYKFEIEKLC